MFEVRLGRAPGWRVVAPSPPDDVTPEQVRQAVGSSPHAVAAVELSAVFLNRRPGGDIQEWRTLDQELEAAGGRGVLRPGRLRELGNQGLDGRGTDPASNSREWPCEPR